jgi:deoxyhypusine synthase
VRGYEFDVQITTAPVTDGSLSSCPPAEAVTWGKVDKETYRQSTESLPGDYSMMMPFIVKALMEKHGPREPFRLYEKRDTLVETLRGAVRENRDWLIDSLHYPLAHA